MGAADDPDPDGWPVHPAAAFYGLWPRFAAEVPEAEPVSAGSAESGEH
jgi:hypothetical protein